MSSALFIRKIGKSLSQNMGAMKDKFYLPFFLFVSKSRIERKECVDKYILRINHDLLQHQCMGGGKSLKGS